MNRLPRLTLAVLCLVLAFGCGKKSTAPEGATARCRDGSYSHSQNRSGTCAHHGGVAQWGPFDASPAPTAPVEIASALTPTPTPEVIATPTATPSPIATPTPAPAPTPEELYFADIAEYPGWEKGFEAQDYVFFHKPPEGAYLNRTRMWIRMVVKGPPGRVRRQVIKDLAAQGLSVEGYERYTETLEYLSFDCRGKSYRRLSGVDYDDAGTQLNKLREEYTDSYVIPDTLGAKLLDVACKATSEEVAQPALTPAPAPTPATRSRTATSTPFGTPQTRPAFSPPLAPVTPPVAENGSYLGEISPNTGRPKTVHVEGYYRGDGTYVRGHYRSAPRKRN